MSIGDITIGDAWGISKKRSELFQNKNLKKGISLILCNTHKGKFLLDHIDIPHASPIVISPKRLVSLN